MLKKKISFGQKMTKLRSTFISIIENLYPVEKYLPEVENKTDSSSNNFKFNSFTTMFHIYTLWKCQKTRTFLSF